MFKEGCKSIKNYLDLSHDGAFKQEIAQLSSKDVDAALKEIEKESKTLIKKIDEAKSKKEQVTFLFTVCSHDFFKANST